jgi:4-alpha-glucanotransferase
LHAPAPIASQQPSPYFPNSRRWRNPLYLRIEEVPGAVVALGSSLDELAAAGRALNRRRIIDRDEVWRLKSAALTRIWEAVDGGGPASEAWSRAQGKSLDQFASYAALAEVHGADWRQWPQELRRPDASAMAGARRDRVAFHRWVQWLIDQQLAAAASVGVGIVGDLAVGADPGGADSWIDQDVLAPGVDVGAPPDDFAPDGQDWGVPPWDPWRLQAAGYEPFVALVRAAMAHGAGLRLDHVAGLFRLFWVPAGLDPEHGVYVGYPWADLCNIVALESQRAGTWLVGEDLGTVEPWVRAELVARNVLSYRLLWFEDAAPADWPAAALGAVSTHDLPTLNGISTGADAEARRRIGVVVDEVVEADLHRRLAAVAPSPGEDEPAAALARRAYTALADGPCLVVAATLDDALGVDERPNMPGTTTEWPNWSVALPLGLEAIETDRRVAAVARAMRSSRPG